MAFCRSCCLPHVRYKQKSSIFITLSEIDTMKAPIFNAILVTLLPQRLEEVLEQQSDEYSVLL